MAEPKIYERHLSPERRTFLACVAQMITRPILIHFFNFKAYGLEHIPLRGGLLVVSNHQSYLDPVLVACYVRRPVCFFAKSYLFTNPLFGWLISSLHSFPVHQGRSSGDRAAIEEAIRRLKAGYALNIYPEGTRSSDGEIAHIHGGTALVARRANVPIVPAVIDGAFGAWPRTRKLFRRHPVQVMYGPVLKTDGMKADEVTRLIDSTLRKMAAELKSRRKERH